MSCETAKQPLFIARRSLLLQGGAAVYSLFLSQSLAGEKPVSDEYVVRGFYDGDKLVAIVYNTRNDPVKVWTNYAFDEKPLNQATEQSFNNLENIVKVDFKNDAYALVLDGYNSHVGGGYFNIVPGTSGGSDGGGGEGGAGGGGPGGGSGPGAG